MSVINTDLNDLSTWDIDQLIATNTVVIPAGDTALYTIPSYLPPLVEFSIQFQPTGSTMWYQAGTYSTDATVATTSNFVTRIESGVIYIVCVGGTARYFVWQDKVNN